MQNHGPKRVYTPQSLEFWFGKLEHDWERHFSDVQLEEGHRIYRDGEVRELELTASDAIIHRRIDKKDEYSVIEWDEQGVCVRSSSTDTDMARALAVAGLHEIEELVADEISPLPEDTSHASPAGSGGSPQAAVNHAHATGHAADGGHSPAPRHPVAKPSPAVVRTPSGSRRTPAGEAARAASRPLILIFTTTADGLMFQAKWVNADKKRVPALGQSAQAAGHGHATVSSSERAKLIGLAAYARKAHFTYNQVTGLYLLSSVVEIPNFLRTTLPAWKKLFSVELDAQSGKLLTGAKEISVEAVATSRKGRSEGQGLDLRWIFRAGERLLTDEEVSLITRKATTTMIIPDIGIVSLPVERLASISSWHRTAAEAKSTGDLSPYLIFSLYSDSRVKLTLSPELEDWRRSVLMATPPNPKLPDLLRPYQRRGVEWMHHLCDTGCHGLLADEMGLGKTLQVLTLLASRPRKDHPSIIVCPASVVPVWREEIARFYPHLAVDVLKTGHDFATRKDSVIWLASYTQLRKHRPLLDKQEFAYAVLDEGQFIKNPDAKVTQTCFAIRARHRIVLTGTPLENRQLDLWSIFRFLLPGLLGQRAAFENSLVADRAGTLDRLRAQLAPFILRRTKNEVATELPQKVEMELLCPLTDVQRSEYAKICAEGLNRLGDDVEAAMREKSFGFLALLTRLRQVCCDPDMLPWLKAPLSDSGKITLLIEKLAEVVASGHKVVIFSQFVMLLDRVREALAEHYPDLPRYELTGMTLDRLKPVQSFQNAEGAAVMLVSLKAAGTGITLHAADYVFLLDPWWNPAVEAQAVDRVHRIGQKSTVFVYRMVTAGTIEERIQAMKATKKDLFDRIVGGLGGDFDLTRHFSSLNDLVRLTTSSQEDSEATV
jgi:superfamily II DNA or RNA helicase